MPKSLGIILNYMQKDIQNLQDDIKDLNVEIAYLEEYSELIENKDDIILQLNRFFDDLKLNYEEFSESFYIQKKYGDSHLKEEVQIQKSQEYLDDVKKVLQTRLQRLKRECAEKKDEYQHLCHQYLKYLNIFDNMNLRTDIKWEEVSSFVNFLYTTTIDKDIINEFERWCQLNFKSYEEEDVEVLTVNAKVDVLSEEQTTKIQSYINDYNNLSDIEKNNVHSAMELINQGFRDELPNLHSKLNFNEILYYVEVYHLKEIYDKYLEKTRVSYGETRDQELMAVLQEELNEIVPQINHSLDKIESYVLLINEEDEEVDELLQSNNLVLFLNIDDSDKNNNVSVTNIDLENIQNNYGGDSVKVISKIMHIVNNQLRVMDSNELHSLGHNRNKPLSNGYNDNFVYFDKFNVRVCKGLVNNPSRITYLTVSLSEKNQKELQEKYYLGSRPYIYLILGLFAKNNADDRYVDITHSRIRKAYEQIMRIQKIFGEDFTDETRDMAFRIIDDSKKDLDYINNEYLQEEGMVK